VILRFLEVERAVLDRFLPGLDTTLADVEFTELERAAGPGLQAFRGAEGPGLLVPSEHGGQAAGAQAAVRLTRAIGARSPSLAVAATMHNFSVAGLVEVAACSEGFEWMLLDAIARDRLLVCSAFAEGRSGQNILRPALRATAQGDGWLVSGSKKPCSLSRSADLITASVALPASGTDPDLGIAVISSRSAGVSVQPFWASPVLAGAQSDELVLDNVRVDPELMVRPAIDPVTAADGLQQLSFTWFTLLISAAYLGAASGLAERLIAAPAAPAPAKTRVLVELENAMLALDKAAADLDAGHRGEEPLARALVARYATQGAIRRATELSIEALGGMAFITSPDIAALAAVPYALGFHPPSLGFASERLSAYFGGAPLSLD
jgi:alkylation response protein AidB-like acyl-CoA dehydrogenase